MTQAEREFYMLMRQALLMQLDAIERYLEVSPRTAEIRKMSKENSKDVIQSGKDEN